MQEIENLKTGFRDISTSGPPSYTQRCSPRANAKTRLHRNFSKFF